MKFNILLFILAIAITSCNRVEVSGEQLPEVASLTPTTISTALPVFNIDTDPAKFERMTQLYHHKIVEKGTLSFYNSPDAADFAPQTMEYEIRGRSSVGEGFPLKSLGVVLDNPITLGQNSLPKFQVNNAHSLQVLKAFRFRSSGNDFGKTMLKDLAYARLAAYANLDLELMYGEPVQVFVNNSYYGLMNVRTESDANGMAGLLDVDPSEVTLIKVKGPSENLKYHEGDPAGAEALLQAIAAEDAQAIAAQIDIPNFIDYIIFQDYIGNTDWANNIKAYNVSNGKFRFILYDVDLASNASSIALIPKLEFLSADIAKIYRALQQVDGFDDRLNSRRTELYQRFSVHAFETIVDDLALQIENDIPYLIAKYGQPESTFHWKMEIENLKLDFAGRDKSIRKRYKLD
jgi:hypothetical protein